MNKFGNTVTSARRQLDMYLFMYVSDVVALNDSASPTDSYCYFERLFDKNTRNEISYKDGITSPRHIAGDSTMFEWKPPDLVAVNRKSTAFPQVMRMFGAPDPLTVEMEARRMRSWKHTVAFGGLTGNFKSYAVYEMEDGMILRLDTVVPPGYLTGAGRWTIPATLYVFDKKHLSEEQISGLSSVTSEIFQSASGGNA